MKIAIVGQQDFGKAVLEAFLARKDEVAAVFCAPEKPGARPDALKVAAQEKGVKVLQFASLKSDEAKQAMKDCLARIQSGEYARDFILENRAGAPTLNARRRLLAEHDIEIVGEKLRAMMPWIRKNKLVDQTRN